MTQDEVEHEITNDFRDGYLSPYIKEAEALDLLGELVAAGMAPLEANESPFEANQRRGIAVLTVIDRLYNDAVKEHGDEVRQWAREALRSERESMRAYFRGKAA